MATLRLFAYGTLQLPDILQAVVGQRWQGEPAQLGGYTCFRVRDKPYPAIVADPSGSVPGILYSELAAPDLAQLDSYEGELYERRELRVSCSGTTLAAFSYVLAERHRALLSNELWDLRDFERKHLAGYLQRIAGTRRAP